MRTNGVCYFAAQVANLLCIDLFSFFINDVLAMLFIYNVCICLYICIAYIAASDRSEYVWASKDSSRQWYIHSIHKNKSHHQSNRSAFASRTLYSFPSEDIPRQSLLLFFLHENIIFLFGKFSKRKVIKLKFQSSTVNVRETSLV